jgi:hypothetical protein
VRDFAGKDAAAAQLTTQRHDRVPGGDVARGRLGQERLIRHVRLGIDYRNLDLRRSDLPGQAQRGVEPNMPRTDNQNALRPERANLGSGSLLS